MGRQRALAAALVMASCTAALLWRQAAAMESPIAVGCEAPVRVHGVLMCAHDGGVAPSADNGVACVSLLRAGEQVRCERGGIERGHMRAPELAALEVLLQLNEAPSEALESIPGVGPVLAARICEQRPFRAVSEVLAVRGVGVRKREAIAARACVDCAPPRILRF